MMEKLTDIALRDGHRKVFNSYSYIKVVCCKLKLNRKFQDELACGIYSILLHFTCF